MSEIENPNPSEQGSPVPAPVTSTPTEKPKPDGTYVSVVKAVTYGSNGAKQTYHFPCNGGVGVQTSIEERADEEYYTPQGIEIDVSGTALSHLTDPRTGKPYAGVVIHIPADGSRLTERPKAYQQWKAAMVRYGHHFADVAYFEGTNGKTLDSYRWPLRSDG